MPSQVQFANLGDSSNPDFASALDQTSYSNSSWTPPTEGLVIAFSYAYDDGGGVAPATMSGNSLTWVKMNEWAVIDAGAGRLSLFGANASGSTPGATTVDFNSRLQQKCAMIFCHATQVDLRNGVGGAVIQMTWGSGLDTSGQVNYPPLIKQQNGLLALFMHFFNEATTPRNGWVEMDDLGIESDTRLQSQILQRDSDIDTAISASWTTSSDWFGVAIELKGGPFFHVPRFAMGIR